jgi:DNA-binding MarR family transcriptional regulator
VARMRRKQRSDVDKGAGGGDSVDRLISVWNEARPEVDMTAFALQGRIQRIARYIDTAFERIAARHGITPRDLTLLLALKRATRPLTSTGLLAEAKITSGAMARRISHLEERGLITRRALKKDGRSHSLHLTARGLRLVDAELVVPTEPHLSVFRTYDSPERNNLVGMLRDLLLALESLPDNPPSASRA